jgi:hypothetical protein
MPAYIQREFFAEKSLPYLVGVYDAIGFDVDHCLVKYNVKETTKLMIRCHLAELHENFDYPAEILDFDYERDLRVCTNNVVWDVQHGTILKLVEGKFISHAICGFEKLDKNQIESIYGWKRIFKPLKWPITIIDIEKVKGGHVGLMGFFDSCKIAVICQVVSLMKKGVIKGKTYQQFAFDMMHAYFEQMIYYNDERCADLKNFGKFYPELLKDPEKYIQK